MTIHELHAMIYLADSEHQYEHYHEAGQIANDALSTLAPPRDDTPQEVLLIHAQLLHHVTFSQRRRGLAQEALATAQKAYTIVSRTNSLPDLARANVDLGAAYHYLFDYTRTIEFYSVALALYEQLEDKKEIAFTLSFSALRMVRPGITSWHWTITQKPLQCMRKSVNLPQQTTS